MGGCFSSPEADKSKANHAVKKKGSVAKKTGPTFGIGKDYQILKLLGTGGEGETWLATDMSRGGQVAIKFVKRPIPKPIVQIVHREIQILSELGDGHLNVVHADEVILTRTHIGLVMEFVSGGNLVEYITKMRETRDSRKGLCISEDEACYFFRQLIAAVSFCHKHHVAHRDLKLDNTLLDASNPPRLKLCDFGFAKSWNLQSHMDTMRIGTPEYMAPDLISGRTGYDGKKVDVWASGVLLFVMLFGNFPFEMEDENYVNTAGLYSIWVQQIRTSWRENPNNHDLVDKLSQDAVDLLDRMFDVKQETRISVEEIVKHPWYLRKLPTKYETALQVMEKEQEEMDDTIANERSHEDDDKLKILLDAASRPPNSTDAVVRVSLFKPRRQREFMEKQSLHAVAEDGA